MTAWRVIPGATLPTTQWRNGGGVSHEIVTHSDAAGRMLWQVSIADLERNGPFSHYPGYDRVFTPIAGDPAPLLAFHGGDFESCPLLQPKPFPGDVPTESRIPAPGRAFNAIVDRAAFTAAVTVHRLDAGGSVTLGDAPTLLVHCLSGGITLDDAALQPGDSALGGAGVAAARSPSVILVVAISPASQH